MNGNLDTFSDELASFQWDAGASTNRASLSGPSNLPSSMMGNEGQAAIPGDFGGDFEFPDSNTISFGDSDFYTNNQDADALNPQILHDPLVSETRQYLPPHTDFDSVNDVPSQYSVYGQPTTQGTSSAPYFSHSQNQTLETQHFQNRALDDTAFPAVIPTGVPSYGYGAESSAAMPVHNPQGYNRIPWMNHTAQSQSNHNLRPRRRTPNYIEFDDFGSVSPYSQAPRDSVASQSRRSSNDNHKHNKKTRYSAEKPKKDEERPWIRTNATTKGLSTRTGKINNFGQGSYRKTPHPLGGRWTSPNNNTFTYNEWGELREVSFSSNKLQDFIYSHPLNDPSQNRGKLILWIQKRPGDSSKRFESQNGDKCRFDACPTRVYKNRTIKQGHFQVAFDEQFATHGDARNPMHVAGYAHLYCLERFTDFVDICRRCDVRVDDRELPNEPTGEWSAGLGRESPECKMVKEFIAMCKRGQTTGQWANYPPHLPYSQDEPKEHDKTLTCELFRTKCKTTNESKLRMQKSRGANATQFFVNLGDLEVQVSGQKKRTQNVRQQKARKAALEAGEPIPDDDFESAVDESTPANGRSRTSTLVNMQNNMRLNSTGPAPVANMLSAHTASKRSAAEAGMDDDSERVFQKLKTAGDVIDPALQQAFADGVSDFDAGEAVRYFGELDAQKPTAPQNDSTEDEKLDRFLFGDGS